MPLTPPPLVNFTRYGARGSSQIDHDDAVEWWPDCLHGPVRILVRQGERLAEPQVIQVRVALDEVERVVY
jgi:hypothetical protein